MSLIDFFIILLTNITCNSVFTVSLNVFLNYITISTSFFFAQKMFIKEKHLKLQLKNFNVLNLFENYYKNYLI